MATSVPTCSGIVPSDTFVPRAKGTLVSNDGGVASPVATKTAVTTPASPTVSSAHLNDRFMPPPSAFELPQPRPRRGRACAGPSFLLLSVGVAGRDGLDDAERVDLRELRRQSRISARRGLEDEEADLVLRNVDCPIEADARSLARQLLGGRARSPLARGALTCRSAREEGLDEVARHAIDARSACAA